MSFFLFLFYFSSLVVRRGGVWWDFIYFGCFRLTEGDSYYGGGGVAWEVKKSLEGQVVRVQCEKGLWGDCVRAPEHRITSRPRLPCSCIVSKHIMYSIPCNDALSLCIMPCVVTRVDHPAHPKNKSTQNANECATDAMLIKCKE
jgi:hypothetical protein